MRIFDGFDNLPPIKSPVVTVGSYDGVHAGHRVLLERVVRRAQEIGGQSVVVTFSPHPRVVLRDNDEPVWLLNSLAEKELLLEQMGIDNLVVVRFTAEFSRVSSRDFIRNFIVGRLGAAVMVVGYDHHFGHNKEGDFQYLQSLREDFGLTVERVEAYKHQGESVSSTTIRGLMARGEMARVAEYLAHPYFAILHTDSGGGVSTDDPHKLLPADGDYIVDKEGIALGITIKNGAIEKDSSFPPDSQFVITF